MKLITVASRVRNVANKWYQAYSKEGWPQLAKRHSQGIYHSLAALSKDAKAHDVDSIIGNISWTAVHCDTCRRSVPKAVMVIGDTRLCLDCLELAITALKEVSDNDDTGDIKIPYAEKDWY